MQTNSDTSTGIIIKSDRSGRGRYTGEFKLEVLAAYESSSLSGPDFARQHDQVTLPLQRFCGKKFGGRP